MGLILRLGGVYETRGDSTMRERQNTYHTKIMIEGINQMSIAYLLAGAFDHIG